MCAAASHFWMTHRSLFAIVLLAAPAAAEADPEAAAEALFRSGREAAADGDHAQACQRFRESQRLQPAAGTVLNLAICEEQLGQLVEAWQHYHAALDSLPAGDSRREIARARLAKLDARLPRFVVQKTASAPPRTRVRLGRVVFNENSFGVPIPVNPGTHAWVVSSPGRAGRTYTRKVEEGERLTLRVEPGAPLPEPNGERAGAPARSGSKLLGYSLIGVGAASLAVSGVTALMALDRGRTVDDECSGRDCTREGLRAADQGGTLVTWCTVSFVFGVLGAGSGTYLVLSGSSASSAGYASARFQLP
ncbi:MAG TPA: hypothetical protein VI072_23155 [Polyangiaceae bacterium]